jgi:excisionase family DNA binding protein
MAQEPIMTSLKDSMRVREAAAILGVTTKTLRNWDRAGKLRARRHPVNGYRIYLREELLTLLNRIGDVSGELANAPNSSESKMHLSTEDTL